MDSYLVYNALSVDEKEAYLCIVEGIKNYKSNIKVNALPVESINKIMHIVRLENPLLFYFQDCGVFGFINSSFLLIELHYIYSHKEVKTYENDIQQLLNTKYLSKVYGTSDLEKVISIHDLICNRVKYGLNDESHSILGALKNDVAVCDGISYLFKAICDYFKIECMVVDGLGKSLDSSSYEPHGWNRVKIDGDWFNVDVTFDLTIKLNNFIRHDYLFLSDDEFRVDHRFNKIFDRLCNTKNKDYYSINNFVMKNQTVFTQWIKEQIQNNKKIVEFKLPNITKPNELINNIKKCIASVIGGTSTRFRLQSNLGLNVFVIEFFD